MDKNGNGSHDGRGRGHDAGEDGGAERWLNIMWGLAYLESIVGR